MEIKEVKEKYKRNLKVEKELLKSFLSILSKEFTPNEVKQRLEENGFDGVYVIEPSLLDELMSDEINNGNTFLAFYEGETNSIFIKKGALEKYPSAGIHEMGHAYLNSRNIKSIHIDGHEYSYGNGIEEGAMTILMNSKDITRLGRVKDNIYPVQSTIFKELNTLYKYTDCVEYKNLLIHLLKKPEEFNLLIKRIYGDILKEAKSQLIYRCAFDLISATDIVTNCKPTKDMIVTLKYINALYLNVADENVRLGKKNVNNFIQHETYNLTKEESVVKAIFGVEDMYIERMIDLLDNLLSHLENECEFYVDDENSKILLLR